MTTYPAFSWGLDCPASQVALLRSKGAKPHAIWPYISGTVGIVWSADQVNAFDRARIYRVNQGFLQGPADALHGDEFDLEAGGWSIDALLTIVKARNSVKWTTRIYCTWANYGVMKERLAEEGIGRNTWFRIADWNLSQHLADEALHADVYAGQWASPTSNPDTIIPGTRLTLREANVDLNVLLIENTGTWQQ